MDASLQTVLAINCVISYKYIYIIEKKCFELYIKTTHLGCISHSYGTNLPNIEKYTVLAIDIGFVPYSCDMHPKSVV